ncbi:hypothetical protein EV360DRAFT_82736 [Lentinula raphanica]|nr:hypothetical protein EV360DRAFT_82736 [Lentinula raphanica]
MSPQKLRLSNYSEYSSFTDRVQNGGDFESPAKQKELQDAIEQSTGRDIPALEGEIRELDATQSSVQATALKFREIFSPNPVDHLPTEILTEIFLYVRDTTTEYTTTITEGLWPVTHVSRKWRGITVSMPQLWTYISICAIEKPARNQLQLLNTALARSGLHPLQVHMNFACSISGEAEHEIGESGESRVSRPDVNNIPLWPTAEQLSGALIQAIVQHSDRWATASIDIFDTYYLRPIQCRLSSLETLAFYGEIEVESLLFSVAPKLQEVQLLGTDSRTFQLPWTQLVHFQESKIPDGTPSYDLVLHYLEILSQCPQLENFGVSYEGNDEVDPDPYIVHNNLKTFTCSDFYLVRCLTLPSLQDFHLQAPIMCSCCPSEMIPSAHELLTRSQCASSLRVLQLTAAVLNHDIFDLLESTEGLRELHFAFDNREIPDINAFMKSLIARMNTFHESPTPDDHLLPHLETFTSNIDIITSHESPTFDIQYLDETYVDMVEGRWNSSGNGVSQLRVVRFESHVPATLSALTDRCIQRIEKIRDEGLAAYIAARTSQDWREPRKIYVK